MGRAPSLNESLFKGPNCIELLPSAILRFREKDIGVVADIRKAFQMISLNETDRKYVKFLWWKDAERKEVVAYQHTRVVFGVNCSPFLLAAVLQHHLKSEVDDPEYAKKLIESFYVDNVGSSVNCVNEYEEYKTEFTGKLADAEMDLRGWERTGEYEEGSEESNVLGLKWSKKTDELRLSIDKLDIPEKITLRSALAMLHRFFDPIGMICPVLITPKLIIQQGWSAKLGWDKELPEELREEFARWLNCIADISRIKIPRNFGGAGTGLEIHTFCDASKEAYAAVVFLRGVPDSTRISSSEKCGLVGGKKNSNYSVRLLIAKSRITPSAKTITIPRLELMSCLVGAKLTQHVQEALKYGNIPAYYWSDSSTALAWIKRNDEWGTFVGNRVKKILSLTAPNQWSHVAGKDNPADLPSRGCNAKRLLELKWWEGPEWLYLNSAEWPCRKSAELETEEIINAEKKKTTTGLLLTEQSSWFSPKVASFFSSVCIMGYVIRFIRRARQRAALRRFLLKLKSKLKWKAEVIVNANECYLTNQEMKIAEKMLVKLIQVESFREDQGFGKLPVIRMEEDDLLHVKTGVANKEDHENFKFPFLLPKKHPLVDSLIKEAHEVYCHAGIQATMGILRERFWVLQTRRNVSRIIHACVKCQRYEAKPMEVMPASPPESRVTCGEIFTTTGVDLAGPLYLKDGSKVWIVLFTCAVYRAVYLDIVMSLDTATFIGVLERFIFQHGRPNTMYSDNGTNFVGTKNLFDKLDWKKLEAATNVKKMKWILNVPTGAWWGGWWERLIRSVKDLLKRMLGKARLTSEELRNCLAAVAHTINERPLTTLTEDATDLRPLTPALFMRGTREATFPEGLEVGAGELRKQHKKIQQLREDLQARFRKEYLAKLVNCQPWPKRENQCKEGLIVLVGDHGKKRFDWVMGRIIKLFPGKDGEVRAAEVITAKGTIKRPLQNLYPMEMSSAYEIIANPVIGIPDPVKSAQDSQSCDTNQGEVEKKTLYGRIVKKPKRYGTWKN